MNLFILHIITVILYLPVPQIQCRKHLAISSQSYKDAEPHWDITDSSISRGYMSLTTYYTLQSTNERTIVIVLPVLHEY